MFRASPHLRWISGLFIALMAGLGPAHADAPEGGTAPARYHGNVSWYGGPALDGMLVSAELDGQVFATALVDSDGAAATYDLLVPADDPGTGPKEGPAEGEVFFFKVHGVSASSPLSGEGFNSGEDRAIDLAAAKLEICLGAYHDYDRDGAHDVGEPWLAGVTLNVVQFIVQRSYLTTGSAEPSCALHMDVTAQIKAVDWPAEFDPRDATSLSGINLSQTQGVFYIDIPFVSDVVPPPGPTNAPQTATPTPISFPGPTGLAPLPTATSSPSATPTATPTQTPSATVTESPVPTATDTPLPPGLTPTETSTATPSVTAPPSPTPTASATDAPTATATLTATPTEVRATESVLVVNTVADPGALGDGTLSLREALRLVTGDLSTDALDAGELAQITGAPGPSKADMIAFDPGVFPPASPSTIFVQPPGDVPPPSPTPSDLLEAMHFTRQSLPPLSTGNDMINAVGSGVVLAAGVGGSGFDGLVINSPGNVVKGLTLHSFNAGIVLEGGAADNVIGGSNSGDGVILIRNIVGLVMTGSGVSGNYVLGCRMGVDASEGAGDGNATHGILINDGASGNRIGEVALAGGGFPGNVISGNGLDGIAVLGAGTDNTVIKFNRIGTNAAGSLAIPNGQGIVVGGGAKGTLIGSGSLSVGNIISGNAGEGIWIQSAGTRSTVVQSNLIGTGPSQFDPIPNGGDGILIDDGASGNLIGGASQTAGNRIVFNGNAGIRVRGARSVANTIQRNSIAASMGDGIVLESGGNRNLAAPIITAVGPRFVEGVALPGSRIEIFSDNDVEGARYEGRTVTDAGGFFRFDAPFDLSGPATTATATDAEGNTSPFGVPGVAPPTPTAGPSPTARPALTFKRYLPLMLQRETVFASLSVQPSRSALRPGEVISLALDLTEIRALFGLQLTLSFDPAVLEVLDEDPAQDGVQIARGNFPPPDRIFLPENRVDNASGRIFYSLALVDGDGVSGSGTVARLRVRAKAPGRSELRFVDLVASDRLAARIAIAGRGGVVDVIAAPSATPNPTATATALPPSATPLPATASPPPPSATPLPPSATPLPPSATPVTPSATPSATATASDTPPPSQTPTPSDTPTPSETPTPSDTPTPSETPTITPTPSETPTPSVTPTASDTPTPTETLTPSATPRASNTPLPTETPSITPTARPSETALPSATPRPASPTPRPSATPIATPDGCAHPVQRGGFEADGSWTFRGGRQPRYSADKVHDGRRSLLLGIRPGEPNAYAYSTAWQGLAVPAGARSMTVSAWTYQAAEPGGGPDRQLMLVYDIDPDQNLQGQRSPIAYVFGERLNVDAWQKRTLTLDVSAYQGSTLWLYSTVANDGYGGRAWMYLDDIDVAFCP